MDQKIRELQSRLQQEKNKKMAWKVIRELLMNWHSRDSLVTLSPSKGDKGLCHPELVEGCRRGRRVSKARVTLSLPKGARRRVIRPI